MNKDFHYYVTYLAARTAGYEKEEAQTIAYAAQYVDESTKDMIDQKLLPGLNKVTATMEDMWKLIKRNMNIFSEEKTIAESELIWRSFHFLPGNIHPGDERKAYAGEREYVMDDGEGNKTVFTYGEKEKRAFSLMCQPNSVLCEKMINDVTKNKRQKFYLELLGIRMHVLADTWAHRWFAGTPSWWVNEASQDVYYIPGGEKMEYSVIRNWGEPIEDNYFLTTPPMLSFQSFAYLGHGRMGGVPDVPFMRYCYKPQWSKGFVVKDNPKEFLLAFRQMVHAMTCVREGFLFEKNTYADIDSRLENALKTAFENKDYAASKADQVWQPVIEQFYPQEVDFHPLFDKGQWKDEAENAAEENRNQTHYYYFNYAAVLHQRFVTSYIEDLEIPNLNVAQEDRGKIDKTDYVMLCREGEEKLWASTQIEYLSHDGSRWSAQYIDRRFYLYSKGKKERCHTSNWLDYIGEEKQRYRAVIENDLFKIQKLGEDGKPEGEFQEAEVLKYLTWNGKVLETSLVTWQNAEIEYLNKDFRTMNMKLFAFKTNDEERIRYISPRVPYICIKEGKGEDKLVFENMIWKDADSFSRINRKENLIGINLMTKEFYFSEDGQNNSILEIRGKTFIVNDVEKDSISVMDWDGNKIEVSIIDWKNF